jgi:hypothetical protein
VLQFPNKTARERIGCPEWFPKSQRQEGDGRWRKKLWLKMCQAGNAGVKEEESEVWDGRGGEGSEV